MPYIRQVERDELDPIVDELAGVSPLSPGQLNYCVMRLCLAQLPVEAQYDDFNEVLGVLEGVKLELYRTRMAVYEDRKRRVNGDVEGVRR